MKLTASLTSSATLLSTSLLRQSFTSAPAMVGWLSSNMEVSPKPKQCRVAAEEDDVRNMVVLLAKLGLNFELQTRLLSAVVFDIITLPSTNPVVAAMQEEGIAYNNRTKGRKGHNEGAPHVHVWVAMTVSLKSSGKLGPEADQTIKAYRETIGDEKRGKAIVSSTVRMCRTKTCYDKTKVNIMVAVDQSPEPRALWQVMRQALLDMGGEYREGAAPQGGLARDVQKMLDKMEGKDGNA